ncbi:Uncharacterised protein [Streptococcus pneumoniae]|nr:Uncharacterised protein [Streptococcus pneumoniae]
MAVNGDTPDKICPVIMPGKLIIPIPTIELIVGKMAESKASRMSGAVASFGVAPSISAPSI